MENKVKKAGPRGSGSELKFGPVKDARVVPGKAQRALKNGPHSKQQNADGTNHSTPSKHKVTDGGNHNGY
jgi:hypothetical protein